ncbi:hypothetical protein KC19_7G020100 [Ceratodon purpureus]|uniref:Uncharacterized protein n=1 Tax=Ceratodon purpureus TaxID=3225 RepID=A0A8T0H5B3_CERPU|nr:hypothetical protein KC19_7G020100 [Ceratodon purpureus]
MLPSHRWAEPPECEPSTDAFWRLCANPLLPRCVRSRITGFITEPDMAIDSHDIPRNPHRGSPRWFFVDKKLNNYGYLPGAPRRDRDALPT